MRSLAILSMLIYSSNAFALSWVKSENESCKRTCQGNGLQAVTSGTYTGNGNSFYVCSANVGNQGFRAGFNLMPTWGSICVVGYGNSSHDASVYYCLCN